MDLPLIPVKSWTTRQEAQDYCTKVAATIPGARVEHYSTGQQVRTTDGHIPVYFKRADNEDIKRTPHLKGLYQRCK
jgi:hypothetical protein